MSIANRHDTMQVMEDWDGFGRMGGGRRTYTEADLGQFIAVCENHTGMGVNRHRALVEEVMTTDSFPLMFADVISRKLENEFQGVGTPLLPLFGTPRFVDSFGTIKTNKTEGLASRLQIVGEKGEYLAAKEGEAEVTWNLDKYGKQTDFSWEAFLRDSMGIFARFPGKLARSAINTEAWLQTTIFYNAAGPIDATFTGTGGQAAVSALPLTEANLETATEAMGLYTSNGEPILTSPVFLVTGPALEHTAKRIMGSLRYNFGSDDDVRIGDLNTIAPLNLQYIKDPWIPIVVTTGTIAATTWFLTADPASVQGAEFGYLTGRSTPELWQKAPDAIKLGGGPVGPMEGDFATDNMFFRVRHTIGATALEHRALWASDGQ